MAKWHYGIVIDAGSSGSRIHIYKWLNPTRAYKDASPKKLESLPVIEPKEKWTYKIHPGISTFGDKPELVGPDHLQELFDFAAREIPAEDVSSTPIFLLATAGMRLLPELQRRQLLDRICAFTRSYTNFRVSSCDVHFQVISGETEGLFGWIATNYLLGGFDDPGKHQHGQGHHTYGFLDMGGASAQIAFAPNATEAAKHSEDLKLVRFRKVNGSTDQYKVFVTTWLEFGVHEARRRYVETLLQKYGSASAELPDPCLPKGLEVGITGNILEPDVTDGSDTHLIGTADFQECLRATYPLLNKNKPCADSPCLLNGVHVPAIDFHVNHFVGVSEYWHTTHEIFEFAHKDKSYDWKTYQERVDEFCTKDWSEIAASVKAEEWGEKVTETTTAEVCFKTSWLINMLHEGIGIPRVGLEELPGDTNSTKEFLKSAKEKGYLDPFQAVNKIDGTEVSWTLGKMVLYASSEIPSRSINTLPVGFGPNKPGAAADFQDAGIYRPSNVTQVGYLDPNPVSEDSWRDTLFNGESPRRLPGLLLFVFIFFIAILLFCGKDRRSRCFHRFFPWYSWLRCTNRGRMSGRSFRPKFHTKSSFPPLASSSNSLDLQQRQGLLENGEGLVDPEDFELGAVDGAYNADEDDAFSDDSRSMRKDRSSRFSLGWGTPRLRVGTPSSESFPNSSRNRSSETPDMSASHQSRQQHGSRHGGSDWSNSGHGDALGRSGLFIRTQSMESLAGSSGLVLEPQHRKSRSRRPSPNRKSMRSPLAGDLGGVDD